MSIINQTTLATSQPLNFQFGFPFFPAGTSADNPIGVQRIGTDLSEDVPRELLNLNFPILLFRLRTRITSRFVATAFFGYNLGYTLTGQTFRGGLRTDIRISEDRAGGGLGVGLGFEFALELAIDQAFISFDWRSGIRRTWEELFQRTGRATFDLIRIVLEVLARAGFNTSLTTVQEAREASGTSRAIWGLLDSASNQLVSDGQIVFRPKVSLHGDLLKRVPPLKAAQSALKKIGAKVTAGPQINLTFPVTINLVNVSTDSVTNQRFRFFLGSGVYVFGEGNFNIPDPTAPPARSVSVTHRHTVGIEVTFEFKVKLKLWSIFSEQLSVPIDAEKILGFPLGGTVGGPFFGALSGTPAATAAAELPQVIWG